MKKIILAIFILAITVAPATVYAISESERLARIQQNCSVLHDNVDALRRHDLVLRLNLGRDYETILRQIDAMNNRIDNNHYDKTIFEQREAEVRDLLAKFRNSYDSYDNALIDLGNINCSERPSDFSDKLNIARTYRNELASHTNQLNDVLQHYRENIVELQKVIGS